MASKSTARPTPTGTITPSIPPEITAPPNDPTAVQLPKRALAALTTIPDYDIDPLLLAKLREKLAKVTKQERRLSAQLDARRGQLRSLDGEQADRGAAHDVAARTVAHSP